MFALLIPSGSYNSHISVADSSPQVRGPHHFMSRPFLRQEALWHQQNSSADPWTRKKSDHLLGPICPVKIWRHWSCRMCHCFRVSIGLKLLLLAKHAAHTTLEPAAEITTARLPLMLGWEWSATFKVNEILKCYSALLQMWSARPHNKCS